MEKDAVKIEELRSFLFKANKRGYASGDESQWVKESDGSTTIDFESGGWRLNDNFFGGEPYGGRSAVFFDKRPVWIMSYYGWVEDQQSDLDEVYSFLREALIQMPEDMPIRGPEELVKGEFLYSFRPKGSLGSFVGKESICRAGHGIYEAFFAGGWVDRRSGV